MIVLFISSSSSFPFLQLFGIFIEFFLAHLCAKIVRVTFIDARGGRLFFSPHSCCTRGLSPLAHLPLTFITYEKRLSEKPQIVN